MMEINAARTAVTCRKPKRLSEEYIYRTDPEESSEEVAKETWKVWGSRILEVNRTEQPSRVPCIRELKLVPWMYFTRYMPKSSLCRACILQDTCRNEVCANGGILQDTGPSKSVPRVYPPDICQN